MVAAIFARLEALGFQRLEYELTPDAIDIGLDAALPRVIELESQIGEFGRGERSQTAATDLFVPARLPLEIELTGVERRSSPNALRRSRLQP